MDAVSRPAVVIDNGTGYTKLGFAGNVDPTFVIPTAVAVNESFSSKLGGYHMGSCLAQYNAGIMADLDFFIGNEALSLCRSSGTYNLSRPIQNSQVTNWDTMEKFWQNCIYNYLNCDPEDHYFLLTESPITSPEDREYTGEIMFETFNVPGLYIGLQPVLALSAGFCSTDKPQMSGVVVDIGDGATHVVPVVDGYVIGSSIKSFPISGNDVTRFVLQILQERGELIPLDESLEIAQKVKEMYCYTASDIVKEYKKHDKKPEKYIKQWSGIKPKTGVPFSFEVGAERFLGPEVFFQPEMYCEDYDTPLYNVIDKCVQSTPIDTRRSLYKNVVLSGGSTMFKGFQKRLQANLKRTVDDRITAANTRLGAYVKSNPVEVNVISHPVQKYAVWFGGSVVASLPEFHESCRTKEDYDEHGASICRTSPIFKGMY